MARNWPRCSCGRRIVASILVVESDEGWSKGLVGHLRAAGHLVSHARTWSQGVGLLLRERSMTLLLVASRLPDISFRELCLFLRARNGEEPLILLRLPGEPDEWPDLRRKARSLVAVDGTLDPRFTPLHAAEVVEALARSLGADRFRDLGGATGERVIVAADRECTVAGALRATGLRVAEVHDLAGLERILEVLSHEGAVFVQESLLAPDQVSALARIQRAAGGAMVFVVGSGATRGGEEERDHIRWIAPDGSTLVQVASGGRSGPQGKVPATTAREVRPSVTPE